MTTPAAPARIETNFTDLPAGQMNLWFVDVSNVWKTKPAARDVKNIRKILVHHHAGYPHDLSEKHASKKAATGEAMPNDYADISTHAEYQTKPYGYHFDVPFVEEKSPDGKKLVVYMVNQPDTDPPHTGAGQNETGIGISLLGTMRSAEEFWDGRSYGANADKRAPEEYKKFQGLPSANQRRILPVLVRYVQETYGVADCFVQAHFQHGKPTCPGFDTERWVLDHEESAKKAGKAFCYPVALSGGGSGGSGAPFLGKPKDELSRCATYMRNTREGKSGFFPFGRRGFWHDGVHLFPGAGAQVYAVHDGWVIAARFEKSVVVDGIDYGSAAFVLVQHEDPGFNDLSGKLHDTTKIARWQGGKWVWGTVDVAMHPTYYSLYMHLKPLDESVAWVKLLKQKDPAAYGKIVRDKVSTFIEVALPVKAGDVIGAVGTHDPFAGMDKTKAVADKDVYADKHHSVLHFEMFSAGNLVGRLESAAIGKKWLVEDADANALSEAVAAKLKGVEGMKPHAQALADKLEDMDRQDPRHEDPSRMAAMITDDVMEPLSLLICGHVNEWGADWKGVLEGWYREWGLAKAADKKADEKRIAKTVKHALAVIEAFKWDKPGAVVDYRKRALWGDGAAHAYYYHPIRLLNWLNGLKRTADVADLKYNTTEVSPFDVAKPRNLTIMEHEDKGSTRLILSKSTGAPAISDPQKLVGAHVARKGTREFHTVVKVTENKANLELMVSPGWEEELKKGDSVRVGGEGWRWVAEFAWETALVGPAQPAAGAGGKGGGS